MVKQAFDTIDVLRLEVEKTPTSAVNLIQNPSGELGGWGWLTPVAGSKMARAGSSLAFTTPAAGGDAYFTSENLPVAAGQYVSASYNGGPFGGTVNDGFRVRFEFYNAAGALISSTATSDYSTGTGGAQVAYGSFQAPAGTVAARLRIDVYSGIREVPPSPPAANSVSHWDHMTVVKSATATSFDSRTNKATNPSFETNAAGWVEANGGTVVRDTAAAGWVGAARGAVSRAAGTGLRAQHDFGDPQRQTFTASAYVRSSGAGRNVRMRLVYGGDFSLTVDGETATDSATGWTRVEVTGSAGVGMYTAKAEVYWPDAPAGEVHYVDGLLIERGDGPAGTYFDGSTPDTATLDYSWTGTAHASTSTQNQTGSLGYIEPVTYIDVLGPTHTIKVGRNELNVGTLSAEILDASLDPSQQNLIRPGKRVRLMVKETATGAYTPIFTGKVLRGTTKYNLRRNDAKRARVTLTAVDALAALSQNTRTKSVATIAELPYVLEGCGVPWNVNGDGDQVANATVVATNDNGTAVDQLATTRDSALGYAWIDRRGIVQAWDRASISGAVAGTLAEDDYTEADVDYDTDRCINSVTVKLRSNVAETTYGPYVDQASIDAYGVHAAEFTVQGVADTSGFANTILAANATPAVRVNKLTVPIRTLADLATSKALLDLYDLITVQNANAGIGQNMRATGIEHVITPNRWDMDVSFTVSGSVASPQVVADAPAAPAPGSWTPAVLVDSGALGAYAVSNQQVAKVGRIVQAHVSILITNVGTASGGIKVSLPYPAANGVVHLGDGRESQVTGWILHVTASGGTHGYIARGDNGSPLPPAGQTRNLHLNLHYLAAS